MFSENPVFGDELGKTEDPLRVIVGLGVGGVDGMAAAVEDGIGGGEV